VRPIRVLVADDHRIVREGLVRLLEASGDCEVVAQAADGLETLERAREARPDVVVLDLAMPRLGGLEALRRLHRELPQTRVLVLTVHDEEEYVLPALAAGAAGYLLKDAATHELLAAVHALHRGQGYLGPGAARAAAAGLRSPGTAANPYGTLTPREREVFHLVADGKTIKEIGRALGIGAKTAENHRSRLLAKLELRNAAELVRYAARRGLLP
jgi:DNA-binding NarL/FixJ family response regulator